MAPEQAVASPLGTCACAPRQKVEGACACGAGAVISAGRFRERDERIKPGAPRLLKRRQLRAHESRERVGNVLEPELGRVPLFGSGCRPILPSENPNPGGTGDYVSQGRTALGTGDTGLIDGAVIDFMSLYDIPNGALAVVSANGHLVYAKGFTNRLAYASAGIEPFYASEHSRFRIGSVSKVLTGLTVVKLFTEMGAHPDGLKAKVADIVDLGAVPFVGPFGGPSSAWLSRVDPRLKDIEVRHLLAHSAGWFRNLPSAGDDERFVSDKLLWPNRASLPPWPMAEAGLLRPQRDTAGDAFASIASVSHATYPVTGDRMLRFGNIEGLSWQPGDFVSYNNYGYWLLGKVIEGVTCRSYESVVRELLLRPIGMRETFVGDYARRGRRVHEVPYFVEDDPAVAVWETSVAQSMRRDGSYTYADRALEYEAYAGKNLQLTAPTGGWVSSVYDLALLARELFVGPAKALNTTALTTALQRAAASDANSGWTYGGLSITRRDSGALEYDKSGHLDTTMAYLYTFGTRNVPAAGASVVYVFNRNSVALATENTGEHDFYEALHGNGSRGIPPVVTLMNLAGTVDLFQ